MEFDTRGNLVPRAFLWERGWIRGYRVYVRGILFSCHATKLDKNRYDVIAQQKNFPVCINYAMNIVPRNN